MKQKRILVTGAGSGFGREVALRLAARGHRTIAGVRGAGQAADLREEAGRRGVPLRVETLDITVAADRERAWEWDIDVLLNNAGSAEAGASAEIPLELVRALFETNVFANLELTQGFVRRMVEQKRGGKVLFVSSIAGLITGPYTGPYCASKHALEAFAEALHAELKPFGIQVGTINPGPYQTGFNDRMMETLVRPAAPLHRPQRRALSLRAVRSGGNDRADGRAGRGRRRTVPHPVAGSFRRGGQGRAGAGLAAPPVAVCRCAGEGGGRIGGRRFAQPLRSRTRVTRRSSTSTTRSSQSCHCRRSPITGRRSSRLITSPARVW